MIQDHGLLPLGYSEPSPEQKQAPLNWQGAAERCDVTGECMHVSFSYCIDFLPGQLAILPLIYLASKPVSYLASSPAA